MKTSSVLFLSLLIIGGISCKKSTSTVTSPTDKRWVVTTFAGNGIAGFNDGPNSSASFRAPLDVVVALDGAIYVADAINHRIRKIAQGQVSTFAGVGFEDTTSGDHTIAGFAHPSYLALDAANNLYTLDVNDPRVRKVSPLGYVSVVAGNGINGFADGSVNLAEFGSECSGIALDADKNIYVLDWRNRRVRKVTVEGEVKTFTGNGQIGFVNGAPDVAEFYNPSGLVIDQQGNLFVGDQNCIRKITPDGVVSTFSGNQSIVGYKDGDPGEALFSFINDITIDEQGNIYASDDNRIRKITPQGVVSTIAGNSAGYIDGEADVARFNDPVGLAVDKQGNIYVADDHNNRIRKISFE
jgi:NHL repeat-containing protein